MAKKVYNRKFRDPTAKQVAQRRLWMLTGWAGNNAARTRLQYDQLVKLPDAPHNLLEAAHEASVQAMMVQQYLNDYIQSLKDRKTD